MQSCGSFGQGLTLLLMLAKKLIDAIGITTGFDIGSFVLSVKCDAKTTSLESG